MTLQETTKVENQSLNNALSQSNWLQKINFTYGLIGTLFFFQFTSASSLKSFMIGWFVSVVNLEIFKRLGLIILNVFQGGKVNPLFYLLILVKFSFWGLIIALFSSAVWIQAIPFVLGNITLIIAAFALGIREMIYARTS